jgi:hypothetical protein
MILKIMMIPVMKREGKMVYSKSGSGRFGIMNHSLQIQF